MSRVESDEVGGKAESESDGEEESPLAEADFEVIESGDEGVADAGESADHYVEIESDVA